MSKLVIVTDSTVYLPNEITKQYGIVVAPQVLIWGNETFEDGVDIQPDEFYSRLKTATVMPTTSQVTIPYFQKIFREYLDKEYEILAILISAKLSGTIDSALQARDLLPKGPIEIVDSHSTSMAMGFHILTVARAAQQGASLAECKALAEKAREYTGVIFAVDTLEFLHRGGRIGGGSRFLGTALNIKPILEVTGGRVEAVERVRTRNKSLHRVVDMIVERTAGKQPVRLAALHANAADEAKRMLELACQQLNPVESFLTQVSPVVGTHAGPGTVGLAFMAGM
jgi:DegV family protein with EDD domain